MISISICYISDIVWSFHSKLNKIRVCHSSYNLLGKLYLIGGKSGTKTTEFLDLAEQSDWRHGLGLKSGLLGGCAVRFFAPFYSFFRNYFFKFPNDFLLCLSYKNSHLETSFVIFVYKK